MFLLHVTVRIDKKYNTLSNSHIYGMNCFLPSPGAGLPRDPNITKGKYAPRSRVSLQDDASQM